MFSTILVAIDGSPQSHAVIELSRKVSEGRAVNVHVLCVVDGAYFLPEAQPLLTENPEDDAASDGLVYPPANHEYHEAQHIVNGAVQALATRSRHVSGLILGGEPTAVIIREAARLKVDVIVMGHRHLSSLQRWVENSIVKEVIDLAACPVLVENQDTEPSG